MRALTRWFRLWFTFESRVGRREYLLSGIGLAIVKYAGDALLVGVTTGSLWTPWDYLSPVHTLVSEKLVGAPPALLPMLALWARTRLEGSTWYEMRLYPEAYWVLFGDALIARIHRRVLAHIEAIAECEAATAEQVNHAQ